MSANAFVWVPVTSSSGYMPVYIFVLEVDSRFSRYIWSKCSTSQYVGVWRNYLYSTFKKEAQTKSQTELCFRQRRPDQSSNLTARPLRLSKLTFPLLPSHYSNWPRLPTLHPQGLYPGRELWTGHALQHLMYTLWAAASRTWSQAPKTAMKAQRGPHLCYVDTFQEATSTSLLFVWHAKCVWKQPQVCSLYSRSLGKKVLRIQVEILYRKVIIWLKAYGLNLFSSDVRILFVDFFFNGWKVNITKPWLPVA